MRRHISFSDSGLRLTKGPGTLLALLGINSEGISAPPAKLETNEAITANNLSAFRIIPVAPFLLRQVWVEKGQNLTLRYRSCLEIGGHHTRLPRIRQRVALIAYKDY
jgi:hypothetical protein